MIKLRKLVFANSGTGSQRMALFRRERSNFHLERKLYHMLMGVLCFCLYAFILTKSQAVLIIAIIGVPWVTLDFVRRFFPKLNKVAVNVFGKLMRKEEHRRLTGNSYYILGLFTITLLFPKSLVLFGILFLAFGDPVAAIVGTLWGKTKILGSKSLEGSLANYVISFFASFFLSLLYLNMSLETAIFVGVLGGLVSVISELLPLPVDDNFSIPVFSVLFLHWLSLLSVLQF